MMKPFIRFTKMHGLGNDFVILNAVSQNKTLPQSTLIKLANRHTGIGFDQLLVIEPSQHADFFCRIYNADGSEAEQCGNGLRCIARYIHEEKLLDSTQFRLETKAGIFPLEIQDYDHIRLCMGQAHITHPAVELRLADHSTLSISILSLGNPHAITRVDSIDSMPVENLAAEISDHSFFPNGVNVGFMQIINSGHIRLRTVERGAGETFACGSSACAAAVTGITQGWLQPQVQVDFAYGSLMIDWEGENQPIYMTGPAARVYSGEISTEM